MDSGAARDVVAPSARLVLVWQRGGAPLAHAACSPVPRPRLWREASALVGQVCLAAEAGPGKDVDYLEQLWQGAVKIAMRHLPDRLPATVAQVAGSPPPHHLRVLSPPPPAPPTHRPRLSCRARLLHLRSPRLARRDSPPTSAPDECRDTARGPAGCTAAV